MNVLNNLFNFCLWAYLEYFCLFQTVSFIISYALTIECCKSSFLCWFPGSYQSNTGKVENNGNIFDIKLI